MDNEHTFDQTPEPAAPEHLRLVEVTDSGRALLLRDGLGAAYILPITPQLRGFVHGGTPRRSETKMTSSLRPRDIQNRIRSGETPESVAEAAGTTVDAIMSYVAPVVAEREHVAATAQRASLRRGPGEPPTTPPINRVLGAAVAAHLRTLDADPETVTWDAYRRETGRWVLTAAFDVPGRSGTARFTFDAPGNYALTDNDDARWLIGDVTESAPVAEPVDDLQQARRRRLAATSTPDDLPLGGGFGEDALGLVDEGPASPAGDGQLPFDEPLRATVPEPATAKQADEPAAERDGEQQPAEEAGRARRQAPKKRGRASVPSWDEIMFGPTGD